MDYRINPLDYESRPRGRPRCVLEMDTDTASLTLPLTALWLALVPIGMSFAITLMGTRPGWHIFRENAAHGWPRDQWPKLAVIVVAWTWITGTACLQLYYLLRYRRVPSTLRVNRTTGVLSIRDTRSPREKQWPLASVRRVRLKRPLSALSGQRVGELLISTRRPRQAFRFRVLNADIELAEEFAAWLNDSRPSP